MNNVIQITPERIARKMMNNPSVLGSLIYGCYKFNRDKGMTAESAAHICPARATQLEALYQEELNNA